MKRLTKTTFVIMLTMASYGFAQMGGQSQVDSKPADLSERTVNISVNPGGLLLGIANIGADFVVRPGLAIGPTIEFTTFTGNGRKATGYGLGGQLTYFFNQDAFTNGWMARAQAVWQSSKSEEGTVSGSSLAGLVGYGWFWNSGFNLNLAGGLRYLNLDTSALGLGTISGLVPSVAFNVGYVF